jgi:aminoglycoside phosphotransferase (APT) family kinase protein
MSHQSRRSRHDTIGGFDRRVMARGSVLRMGEGVVGIDVERVSAWLEASVPGTKGPFDFTLIAGGRSNLTFRVTDAHGRSIALRRPPVSHVLPTAHDMVREYTVISALGPAGIPVPDALALCEDDSVNERPFYVMSFVDGHILRSAAHRGPRAGGTQSGDDARAAARRRP